MKIAIFKKLIFLFLIINFAYGQTITIAVAANASYVIPKLVQKFKQSHPNIDIKVILGASGNLTAQINQDAPYDIFMSANMKYPNALYKTKKAITKPKVYAKGSLAILSITKRDFSKGIDIILDKDIKTIAVANPKTAPYGIVTKQALKNSMLYDKVRSKFVYGQSISQTLTYTLRAANIGFVAKSLLFSSKMARFKKGINWEDVDHTLYKPIDQGIVILLNGKNKQLVKEFYDFIFTNDAKKILENFGYIV